MAEHGANTPKVDPKYKSFMDLNSIEGAVQKELGKVTEAYTTEMLQFTRMLNKLIASQAEAGKAEASSQAEAGKIEGLCTGLAAGGALLGTAAVIGYNKFGGSDVEKLKQSLSDKTDELHAALNEGGEASVLDNPEDAPSQFNQKRIDGLKAEHAKLAEQYRAESTKKSAVASTVAQAATLPTAITTAGARTAQGSAQASAALARTTSQTSGQGVQATQGTVSSIQQALSQIVTSTNPYQAAVASSRNR